MKTILILFIICFLHAPKMYCQDYFKAVKSIVLESDTVLILSHEELVDFYEDSLGNSIPSPTIVEGGKVNEKIVLVKNSIKAMEVFKLNQILTRQIDKPSEKAGCFNPRHSLIFIKESNIHYIDICFSCERISASKELQIDSDDFDLKKWEDLKGFFKNHGL